MTRLPTPVIWEYEPAWKNTGYAVSPWHLFMI